MRVSTKPHFRKIANRAFIASGKKYFVKITGKIFGEIVLGKIWEMNYQLSWNFRKWNFAGGNRNRAIRCLGKGAGLRHRAGGATHVIAGEGRYSPLISHILCAVFPARLS